MSGPEAPPYKYFGAAGRQGDLRDSVATYCLLKSDREAAMLDPVELFPEIPNLYEFPSVHADMLFDDLRVEKYAEAIDRIVKEGDVVADVGSGTGLLAFLCLQAGAARVHAIERSPCIKWVKMLADRHGMSDRFVFHAQDSRRVGLPEKVDVVVSELIGHIAFEEGMVESLLDARHRHLSPGGTIIPQSVKLRAALVDEKEVYPAAIDCWRPVKGIDYGLLRDEAVKSCYLTTFSDRDLMSEPATLFAVDFRTDERPVLAGQHAFRVLRPGIVNGIALWFDALLAPGVSLSSGPWFKTHWRQCFAPSPDPVHVVRDERVSAEVRMTLCARPEDTFSFAVQLRKDG